MNTSALVPVCPPRQVEDKLLFSQQQMTITNQPNLLAVGLHVTITNGTLNKVEFVLLSSY